jgi:ketosteroid isomerase-like protein
VPRTSRIPGYWAGESTDNVEIVRASWEAWSRGDMGVFHGHDGIRDFFREWRTFLAEYYAEPEQFLGADDSVVVRVRQGGRGRARTVGVEMPAYWQVYRLREGRGVRVEIYRDEG